MITLDERKKNRWLMLQKFYELANGRPNNYIISLWDVGERLGWDREITESTYDYLEGEGLLQAMSLGGGATITHQGVKEVERAEEYPSEPTLHFPPHIVNITNIGDIVHGDRIEVGGNVIGSALGREAKSKARDISVYKDAVNQSSLDDELKRAILQARELLEQTDLPEDDKDDAIDDFNKLTQELENTPANPTRVQRLWKRIHEIAPLVAATLETASSIVGLLQIK